VIRELRRGQGLRLKDLAECAGISIGYLSRLERGQMGGDNPSMANLDALARALGVAITFLLPPAATTPNVPESELAQNLVGREVLLAITYRQPITLPQLERLCARAGTKEEIAASLDHLLKRGLIQAIPPSAPNRPIFYVLVPDRSLADISS
jgi:transcriptional regulator with XRE-family HTH domain